MRDANCLFELVCRTHAKTLRRDVEKCAQSNTEKEIRVAGRMRAAAGSKRTNTVAEPRTNAAFQTVGRQSVITAGRHQLSLFSSVVTHVEQQQHQLGFTAANSSSHSGTAQGYSVGVIMNSLLPVPGPPFPEAHASKSTHHVHPLRCGRRPNTSLIRVYLSDQPTSLFCVWNRTFGRTFTIRPAETNSRGTSACTHIPTRARAHRPFGAAFAGFNRGQRLWHLSDAVRHDTGARDAKFAPIALMPGACQGCRCQAFFFVSCVSGLQPKSTSLAPFCKKRVYLVYLCPFYTNNNQ